MQIALVHDWLTGMRGGERVLSQVCRLFPQADLYTLVHTPGVCDARIESMRIRASWMSRLPGVKRYYRWLLPLMPKTIEAIDLRDYDLVISLSHCVAKGVTRSKQAAHVCYCFTPMRYVWTDVGDEGRGSLGSAGLKLFAPYLRTWDIRSAANVDAFMSNSQNVAGRIARCYGREARVVYSPVDTSYFTFEPAIQREDWYLVVSALTPYKRVEQAIEACRGLGRRLKIVGGGPELEALRALAAGSAGIEFVGRVSDEVVRDHYRRAKALLMPQEEDFGLTPLEAMACGTPTIAFGAGGALETVQDGITGVLYDEPTVAALSRAIRRFEDVQGGFSPVTLSRTAQRFAPEPFLRDFADVVNETCARKGLPVAC